MSSSQRLPFAAALAEDAKSEEVRSVLADVQAAAKEAEAAAEEARGGR
jgi:hypothetical protein